MGLPCRTHHSLPLPWTVLPVRLRPECDECDEWRGIALGFPGLVELVELLPDRQAED